jgi:two-component sensor histidine kinase
MEGWGWQAVHDPSVLPKVLERWEASIADGKPFEMTFPLRGADGVFRPFLTRVAPVRDASGAVVRWFGVNTDISEQIAAEEAARALLYEVNHRVKNSLQVVVSLLSLQAKSSTHEEVRTGLSDARARIEVVASIHQSLYRGDSHTDLDICEYLDSLANNIVSAHRSRTTVELVTECRHATKLAISQAIPLALIVSELLTNALKYAFPTHGGTLRLTVDRRPEGLRVEVSDDGKGLAPDFDPQRSAGMGMRVIRALTQQLRAEFNHSSTADGARFVLLVPVSPDD